MRLAGGEEVDLLERFGEAEMDRFCRLDLRAMARWHVRHRICGLCLREGTVRLYGMRGEVPESFDRMAMCEQCAEETGAEPDVVLLRPVPHSCA